MTLDEAIMHCLEVAESTKCEECAANHMQLFTWLQEYKSLKQGEE